jgi:hypothetical protein
VLKEADAAFDAGSTRRLLENYGAVHTEEREESEVQTGKRPARRVSRVAADGKCLPAPAALHRCGPQLAHGY